MPHNSKLQFFPSIITFQPDFFLLFALFVRGPVLPCDGMECHNLTRNSILKTTLLEQQQEY